LSLEKKDVRCKLSQVAHAALAAVAEYNDKDLGEYASFLLERAVLGEAHAARVMAERAARWGSNGMLRGAPEASERDAVGIQGKLKTAR